MLLILRKIRLDILSELIASEYESSCLTDPSFCLLGKDKFQFNMTKNPQKEPRDIKVGHYQPTSPMPFKSVSGCPAVCQSIFSHTNYKKYQVTLEFPDYGQHHSQITCF